MTALEVFTQSDGDVTKAYYAQLEERGPIGLIALNLFRACKTSTRAKTYRRRGRREAYMVKNWSLDNLCTILTEHGASRAIRFGWKEDKKTIGFEWVLYVDLPQGQVSFHSPARGQGPDYPGDWDGQKVSPQRILAFCDNVLNAKPIAYAVKLTPEIARRAEKQVAEAIFGSDMEANHVPGNPEHQRTAAQQQVEMDGRGSGTEQSCSLHDGGNNGPGLCRPDEQERLHQYRLPGCDDGVTKQPTLFPDVRKDGD